MSYYDNLGMEPSRLGRGVPVRIGDVERDGAIAALSEHFAAGRLTRDELDERVEQAMNAKFDADISQLLADLPRSVALQPRKASPPPAAVLLGALMPMLLVSVITVALVTGAPWLLWSLFWIFMLGGFGGRRAHLVHLRQHPRLPLR